MFDVMLKFCDNKAELDELDAICRLPFIPRNGEAMLDVDTLSVEIPEPYGNVMWVVWSVDYRRDGDYIPYVWLEEI